MDRSPFGASVSGKVGPKGQVVIPKAFRDKLGMKPGATVFIDQRDDGVIEIELGWSSISEAFERFSRYPVRPGMEGKSSLDILHELDREDEAIWERKYGPWTPPPSSSTPSLSSGRSGTSRSGHGSKRSSPRRSPAASNSD
jgi:AbrB family looped-hinge helix DNA binding protein